MIRMDSVSVYVVDGDFLISKMFMEHKGYSVIHELSKADIVVFPGGADVSPRLYGEGKHPSTFCDEAVDRRHEGYFNTAQQFDKLCVGICRGGQFLNVMSGGRMFQNVDKHAIGGTHRLTYKKDTACVGDWDSMYQDFQVTSTHHQMFRSGGGKSELWGYADLATFKETEKELFTRNDIEFSGLDEEIVYYPETKCLCFQPHPEYQSKSCRELFFICLDRAMKEAQD